MNTKIVQKDTQIEAYRRELRNEDGFYGLLGASSPMQQVFDLIANAAQSDAPVIIFGESGTGKELVARSIHGASTRQHHPYVKVNCSALNESLLISELFGHVKGAIFLDEIGDLPISTQVKLLRVLEEKVVERVGDHAPIHIDVRIISATNKNLRDLVAHNRFREDLFYRINVIPIQMPPLRERMSDIPLLANSFFHRIQLKSGKAIEGISNEAMEALMRYTWPGNVRELKSAFEYAFVTCRESMIRPLHFPPAVIQGNIPPQQNRQNRQNRETFKKERLVQALKQSGGNQSEAARLLGISRVTVWNRMKKYGIDLKKIPIF